MAEVQFPQTGQARGAFEAHGLPGHVELNRHRIAHRKEYQPVPARSHHATGQTHDLIAVLAELHPLLAKRQSQ